MGRQIQASGHSGKLAALLIVLLLAGCTAVTRKPQSAGALEAMKKAEQFVVRHGFTAAGHPPDLPMERVSLYDGIFGLNAVVAQRKGLLQPRAVCVRHVEGAEYSVMFESAKDAGEYWFVVLPPEGSAWLGHQPLRSIWKDCVRVTRPVP